MTLSPLSFQSLAQQAAKDDLRFLFKEVGELPTRFSPVFEAKEAYKCFSCSSNFPFLNGVLQLKSLDPNSFDALISEKMVSFESKAKSHIWWFTDLEQKEKMAPQLLKRGYQYAGDYLIYGQSSEVLHSIKKPYLPPNLSVHEVATDGEFQQFINVLAEIFALDEETKNVYLSLMANYGPSHTYRHFYALKDGEVIGIITGLFRSGACGVWNGGVLKKDKGSGAGRALFLKLYEESLKAEIKVFTTLLIADAQAKGLCHKFKGEKLGIIYPYFLGFSS